MPDHRNEYGDRYFDRFVRDLDGNKIRSDLLAASISPASSAWPEMGSGLAAGLLDQRGNLVLPFGPRMGERRYAILVGEVGVGASLKHKPRRLDMARATIAQDDDLQEAGPAGEV